MADLLILRVADYLALVNKALAAVPRDVHIEGEIYDHRLTHQKWISFDLKDDDGQAVLKCFMTAWQVTVPLEDGMRVRVTGRPTVSPRFGKFQLNVDTVEPVGEGALKRAYELLKKKLLDEGVFDAARKRTVPRFPSRLGLITSRDAAAYGDFLRVLNNRWGGVEIDFVHVHVQGREAVPEIVEAFARFNRRPEAQRPEALVLVRGGGGLEDLHAFNDERVVRAVFQARVPVIVGVGHERDESLCDYAADVRASTPSNAAERAVPSREQVRFELEAMGEHRERRVRETLDDTRRRLDAVLETMGFALERQRRAFDVAAQRFRERADAWLPSVRERFAAAQRLLSSFDPAKILERGYAIVRAGGRVVRDAAALDAGETVHVQLAHGSFDADVRKGTREAGQQALI